MDLGERNYEDDMGDLEYEEEYWRGMERQERMYGAPGRMNTTPYHQNYPVMQRMSSMRMSPAGGSRKMPHIIRKSHLNSRVHYITQVAHQPAVRPMVHQMRMHKMHQGMGDSRSMMEGESSSHEMPYHVPYANEETVRTSEEQNEEEEEEEESQMIDHSMKRLEDHLEVDEEGASECPSTSMVKMVVRAKGPPIFNPADNKALIENHQLKTRLSALIDSNSRFRDEVLQLREEKRELLKQFRKQEKVIEKQSVELAEAEDQLAELCKRDKEKEKKHERELAMKDKRRKTITVMPCLPNRKVLFSKATKQAQSLRLRLLHRYLGELCGPVEGEHRLEEKNLIVLRWRKAHAPKPSLEIGRQLLPSEEDEFCRRFGIVGERKKEMKKWLGQKHIDLFGPSERALAVRKWRMGQREKRRRGEKMDKIMDVEEEILEEAGNDTDDDELMDDIESALVEESGVGEREEEAHIMDDDEEDEEIVVENR